MISFEKNIEHSEWNSSSQGMILNVSVKIVIFVVINVLWNSGEIQKVASRRSEPLKFFCILERSFWWICGIFFGNWDTYILENETLILIWKICEPKCVTDLIPSAMPAQRINYESKPWLKKAIFLVAKIPTFYSTLVKTYYI